jgi:hypothetical protein
MPVIQAWVRTAVVSPSRDTSKITGRFSRNFASPFPRLQGSRASMQGFPANPIKKLLVGCLGLLAAMHAPELDADGAHAMCTPHQMRTVRMPICCGPLLAPDGSGVNRLLRPKANVERFNVDCSGVAAQRFFAIMARDLDGYSSSESDRDRCYSPKMPNLLRASVGNRFEVASQSNHALMSISCDTSCESPNQDAHPNPSGKRKRENLECAAGNLNAHFRLKNPLRRITSLHDPPA